MALASSRRVEVLVVGGQIAAGKTALASGLSDATGCVPIRVRDALQELLAGSGWDRARLQEEGASLDHRTSGRWLLHYLQDKTASGGRWVVDAGRTRRQVEPILDGLTDSKLVYLRAHESIRRQRYAAAQLTDPVKRSMTFDRAMGHQTEAEAPDLAAMAHLVLDTDDLSLEDVVEVVRSWVGW